MECELSRGKESLMALKDDFIPYQCFNEFFVINRQSISGEKSSATCYNNVLGIWPTFPIVTAAVCLQQEWRLSQDVTGIRQEAPKVLHRLSLASAILTTRRTFLSFSVQDILSSNFGKICALALRQNFKAVFHVACVKTETLTETQNSLHTYKLMHKPTKSYGTVFAFVFVDPFQRDKLKDWWTYFH